MEDRRWRMDDGALTIAILDPPSSIFGFNGRSKFGGSHG
jgi:hypothetical protein